MKKIQTAAEAKEILDSLKSGGARVGMGDVRYFLSVNFSPVGREDGYGSASEAKAAAQTAADNRYKRRSLSTSPEELRTPVEVTRFEYVSKDGKRHNVPRTRVIARVTA